MPVTVAVLRVFTDADGRCGNPLGVVDAAAVAPQHYQRIAAELGFSETVFVDLPATASTSARLRIFTPATELPFAGHPTVGATWWLRQRGTPVRTLEVPAGSVEVHGDTAAATVRARAQWAPEFVLHQLPSPAEVLAAEPTAYPSSAHYLWSWTDQSAGEVRSRMFAPDLGVAEDEATGAAAVRLTDRLGRGLTITQGMGSLLRTTHHADGWISLAGRVVGDTAVVID